MNALPREFMNEIEEMLGNESPAFFAALEERPTLALRVNPARPAAMAAAEAYVESRVPWAENGWYLRPDVKPGATAAHSAGAFYLQEASAMVSVSVLQPQPGERILDLCAAPGGKTTQIAAALGGKGMLVSNEPEPSRAKVLAANLERMGVHNAAVVNMYPDGLSSKWAEYFDALLCDAPCSGEGMFRREPDARDEWKPGSPAGCAKRQAEILDRAAEMIRPGGRLVYSTCTFNRAENEETIRAFLLRHPEFTPEDFELEGVGASEGGMIRIWPHRVRGDGHFAARLRKTGSGTCRGIRPASKPAKADLALIDQLEREVCHLPQWIREAELLRHGDYLYAVNPLCPEMKGVRVVSPGVCLLRIGKNYIEPAHALAMALSIPDALRSCELDAVQAQKYLSGEVIEADCGKGWTLVLHQGLALGWAKCSGGVLKNHLPKGLRRAGSVPT